jgi:hypothetical protein
MTDQHQHRAPINLNHEVKVKLTDSGQDVLAMQQLRRQQDADGYIKFQLWELMNIFGVHVYNGCSIPFEFNRILLAPFDSAMTDQLRARVEALEELHKAVVDLNERFNLDPLVARVEALEARYETQRQATLEWSKNVARWIMELEAGQKTKPSPAVDRVLALQDQIRDGALSLADALKEIGASEPAKDPFRRPSLADTLADTHHCSFFNTSVLIRAFKDWLTQEGKAPLAMRELLEAQAQIAESDPHA